MQPGRPPSPSSPFGRPPTGPFSPSAVRMPRMPSQSSMHQSGNGPSPPKPGQMMNVSLPARTNQPHLGGASPRPPRPTSPPPFLTSQQPNRPRPSRCDASGKWAFNASSPAACNNTAATTITSSTRESTKSGTARFFYAARSHGHAVWSNCSRSKPFV